MGQIVKNIITGKKIKKPDPVDSGVPFDGGVMITETDKAGIITYANRKFREMTGYTKEELIGSPHNINRHPDMPKAGFQGMWDTIKSGEYWEGYVKNMRKDDNTISSLYGLNQNLMMMVTLSAISPEERSPTKKGWIKL